jgi:rapamycin-insensitive companion of mTOR
MTTILGLNLSLAHLFLYLQHLFLFLQCLHNRHCSSEQEILELKAALWGCGHVATSPLGISFLAEHGVVQAVLHLVQSCPVYSVRGTAFYVLGLLATTFEGANLLNKAGWNLLLFCTKLPLVRNI